MYARTVRSATRRARSPRSNESSVEAHSGRSVIWVSLVCSVNVGIFYVDTTSGDVATAGQLRDIGIDEPAAPWFQIQAPDDVTTLWHAVLVKEERGIHIGTTALRHGEHHALLMKKGWREVEPESIGSNLPGSDGPTKLSPSPWAN